MVIDMQPQDPLKYNNPSRIDKYNSEDDWPELSCPGGKTDYIMGLLNHGEAMPNEVRSSQGFEDLPDIFRQPNATDHLYAVFRDIIEQASDYLTYKMNALDRNPTMFARWKFEDFAEDFRTEWYRK